MKKSILYLLMLFCFILAACNSNKQAVNVEIGNSDLFTQAELKLAEESILEEFKGFKGATMTKLWYDEEKSDKAVSTYLSNGRGASNGAEKENTIVLFSNFDVDSTGGDGSLNPNSTYTDWMWILIREDNNSSWKVDDMGY